MSVQDTYNQAGLTYNAEIPYNEYATTKYKFVPPTVYETPMAWDRLFVRYGIHRGVTVMMIDGKYSSYRFPSQTEMATATEVYLGGHEYIIDEKTRTRLTDANIGGNYGANITEVWV